MYFGLVVVLASSSVPNFKLVGVLASMFFWSLKQACSLFMVTGRFRIVFRAGQDMAGCSVPCFLLLAGCSSLFWKNKTP